MILGIGKHIEAGAQVDVIVKSQKRCRPIQLLIPPDIAKIVVVCDIQIDNRSYFLSSSEAPGVIFSKDFEKLFKSEPPNLELPIIEVGMEVMVRILNLKASAITFRAAWDTLVKLGDFKSR